MQSQSVTFELSYFFFVFFRSLENRSLSRALSRDKHNQANNRLRMDSYLRVAPPLLTFFIRFQGGALCEVSRTWRSFPRPVSMSSESRGSPGAVRPAAVRKDEEGEEEAAARMNG